MGTDIILDPKIRDWVLLPLTLIMVFMGLGRHYVQMLMDKRRKQEKEQVRDMMTLRRGQMLSQNCYYLPKREFLARKQYYTDPTPDKNTGLAVGVFTGREDEKPDPTKNPMMSGKQNIMVARAIAIRSQSTISPRAVLKCC
eukprot:SAG31_NODE_1500_length_8090_cov_10.522588_9_plen_141_part_00